MTTRPSHATTDLRHRARDEGSALLLVVGVMSTLFVLVSVALGYATQTQGVVQKSRYFNQSLAAAQAGVDDYLARLNQDDNYWRTTDCTNVAMKRAYTSSAPCGWGASTATGWVTVPGSAGQTYEASFHYDAVTTNTPVNGVIELTVTGRAGDSRRTVRVLLRRDGFGEFLYFTIYETIDPANDAVYSSATQAADKCTHYFWEPTSVSSKPRDTNYCRDIQFAPGDVINGPVHSNDTLLIAGGATFRGTVTTSDPKCNPGTGPAKPATQCYRATGTGSPTFQRGIGWRKTQTPQDSTSDLQQYVTPGRTNNLGCLYTGPTRIRFLPSTVGSTPRMTVWSRWSAASTLNPGCGTATDLRSGSGATINVPDNKLILVQDVPTGTSAPADQPIATNGACTAGSIGDGLPVSNDENRLLGEYNCRYGTVYAEGPLRGRTTIAADNSIVVTGDLTYAGGQNGTDALGLIAENSVQVYHPVKKSSTGVWSDLPSANTSSVSVNASILALRHSFGVQYYQYGSNLGTLSVYGSIAQVFRGAVGTSTGSGAATGYLKDYNYDSRLKYSPPPYMLDPVQSSWGQKSFGEIQAAY